MIENNMKIEWVPCEGCKTRGTKWITHNLGTDDEYVTFCTCFKDYQTKLILGMNLKKANIPLSILSYNVKSYRGKKSIDKVEKLKMYSKAFQEKFTSVNLYIYGPNSTQKTTLAYYIGMELLKTEKLTVRYTLMDTLIKDLISSNYGESKESKTIEQYRDADLLIIDESFDKRRITLYKSGYQLSFLDSFLRDRMETNKKATIFISNLDVGLIEGTFGKGLFELIQRNCIQFLMEDRIDSNNFDIEDLWKE
jgi:DNA replication protein DnaC